MRARIWGCRGSLAAPGPETIRYGGNTSCVEVRLPDGQLLVVDAGTGIRNLGVSMGPARPDRIDILLTHLHLDHVEGLGFFTPIWDETCEIHIWGPASPNRTLRQRIATYFSPPLFPVHINDIPSRLAIHDAPEGLDWQIGGATIRAQQVNHPGPTLGYRIEHEGRSLCYISDHEPAAGTDLGTASPEWVSGYDVAAGAGVLFHDAQYTEDEYPQRVGWGHSSIADTVAFALLAKVRQLMLFHHDPLHSDAKLEEMLARAKELWGQEADGLALASEGMELEVPET